MSEIRQPQVIDIPGLYAVCHETSGAAPGTNPDLVGHIYAGPYVQRHPEFARVVVDEFGVSGYVFGCPDTRAFETWAEQNWWPVLRQQYPVGAGKPQDAEMIGLLHAPPISPQQVVADYPAHLHIDLLDRTRGSGFGRTLIDWLCESLAAQGVPGVHLGVGSDNQNAIEFYGHLGFTTLDDDGDTRWMAKSLG